MSRNITATFVRKRRKDSGRDQAPDYYVYEFTGITDASGNKYGDKWIKETGLIRSLSFVKGAFYMFVLSDDIDDNVVNMPYPVEISNGEEKVYIKSGNTIIKVDKNGEERDLSNIMPRSGQNNMLIAVSNKFQKGQLTEDLLLKWNKKGTYFSIEYVPSTHSVGMHSAAKGPEENYVLVQKETQAEIDRNIESIKRLYLSGGIEKYFSIKTEIIPAKKKK